MVTEKHDLYKPLFYFCLRWGVVHLHYGDLKRDIQASLFLSLFKFLFEMGCCSVTQPSLLNSWLQVILPPRCSKQGTTRPGVPPHPICKHSHSGLAYVTCSVSGDLYFLKCIYIGILQDHLEDVTVSLMVKLLGLSNAWEFSRAHLWVWGISREG